MPLSESIGNPRSEIKASLIVLGCRLSAQDIKVCIGENPSNVWTKGDSIQGTLIRRKEDGWRIDSSLSLANSLSEHVDNILDRIYPRRQRFTQISTTGIWLSANVQIYGLDRPVTPNRKRVAQKVSELNVGLDIDIYNFP